MSLSNALRVELEQIVGVEGVLTDPIQLLAYDCDAYTIEKALPTAVVLPQPPSRSRRLCVWRTAKGCRLCRAGRAQGCRAVRWQRAAASCWRSAA